MANTVSILSYANTFGDWIVTTNALAKENNDFAANNYSKPTGTLYLNDPTLGLQVANNAIVAGQLQVQGVGSSASIQNNLTVGKQVYFTNTSLSLVTSGQANIGGPLLAQASGIGLAVSNNATVGGTLTITGATNLNGTLTATALTTLSNTVSISGATTVSNNVTITGNTGVSQFLNVTKDIFSRTTQATNSVIGTYLVANTSVTSPVVYATDTLQADKVVANSSTLITSVITGTEHVDTIIANTSISVPLANVSTRLDANTASGFFGNLQTQGQFVVGGNFVVNGSTVYNSNTFTLNSGSDVGLTSAYTVNRGLSGANAAIRWNELSTYWDLNDVSTGTYYRILTTQQLNNTVTSTSSSTAATANVANTLNNNIISLTAFTQSAYDSANNVFPQVQPAFNKANAANVLAQSAYDSGNSTLTYATAGFNKANASNVLAQSSYDKGNTTLTYATASFDKANAANVLAQASYANGNINFTFAQTGFNKANAANVLAQSAYDSGNATYTYAQSAYNSGNNILILTQAAFDKANTGAGGVTLANSSTTQVLYNSGGTLSGAPNITTDGKNISMSGALTLSATNISTIISPTFQAYKERVINYGGVTGANNINLALGNIFKITLNGSTTFSFTNYVADASIAQPVTVVLTQGAGGTKTATFTNAKYSEGATPTLSTTAGQVDVLTFFTIDGGTTWYGTFAMANVS